MSQIKRFLLGQFGPERTKGQLAFDVLLGIAIPAGCLVFDPVIFRDTFYLLPDAGVWKDYSTIAYAVAALYCTALMLQLLLPRRLGAWGACVAGVCLSGAVVTLVMGIALLRLSLLWVLFGVGLVPFLFSFVLLRNGIRAIRQTGKPLGARIVGVLLLGIALSAGFPFVVNGLVSRFPLPVYLGPDCSDDFGCIVFASNRYRGNPSIFVMRPDGSGLTRLGPGYEPTWSADGRHIAFVGGRDAGIYVMSAHGTDVTLLVGGPAGSPAWSPDGRYVALVSPQEELCVTPSERTELRCFSLGLWDIDDLAWSPDGRHMAFSGWTEALTDSEIFLVDTACFEASGLCEPKIQRLTDNEEDEVSPAWSPREDRIAFSQSPSFTSFKANIYLIDTDGSNIVRLTGDDTADSSVAWSPDGQCIVFESTIREGRYVGSGGSLFVMDAGGSRKRRLTHPGTVWVPDPGDLPSQLPFLDWDADWVGNAASSCLSLLARSVPVWPANVAHPGWTSYPTNPVHGMALDREGDVWIATEHGVVKLNPADGTTTEFTSRDGLADDLVQSVAAAPDGTLWFGTLNGLSHFDGDTWITYTTADGLADNVVDSIAVTAEGIVWSGTYGGLSRFDGDSWTTYTQGGIFNRTNVTSIAEGPDGVLWFGTNGSGIFRFDGERWANYGNEQGAALAVGPDGEVWFDSTPSVSRLVGEVLTEYPIDDGQDYPLVACIAVSPDGTLWVGTQQGGVSRFDGETWVRYDNGNALMDNNVESVVVAHDGVLWVGTYNGVSRYAPQE